MRTISPLDLRRSLGAILDAASVGERFVIERERRPLAMLVSVEDGRRLEPDAEEARARRLAALDHLEALAARLPAGRTPPQPARSPQAAVPAPGAPRPAAPAAPPERRQVNADAHSASAERPAPSASPSPGGRSAADRDRHRSERQRHAGEDLVGLG